MDKRKTWREQEQSLVARWNDAAERQRQLHEELSRQPDETAGELKQKELAVRSEIEGLRREVARLKVQFNSGKAVLTVGNARPGTAADWTKDRIESLTTAEVKQLRVNAERLQEPEITTLCDQILTARRKKTRTKARTP